MENSTTSNGHNNNFVYHNSDFWESPETVELDTALVEFNSAFKAVKRDETVSVPGRAARKFSSLDEVMIEIRPILAKHGLFVQQPITGGKITTIVRHKSGQFRAFSQPMVEWKGQGTTPIQDLGGAITYMRRYALGAALALATEEDDDAQSTGKLSVKKQEPPAPKLDETLVDAWQSKVNDCKEPADFEKLSKEMKDIENEAVKKFVRAAMSKRLADVSVEFVKNATGVGGEFKKIVQQPTEKQA